MTTSHTNKNILDAYPWLKGILAAAGTARTRILMVADGTIDFGHQPFGLSELLGALEQCTTPGGELCITTAHREKNEPGRVADNFCFTFKAGGLKDYDQVWLFGYLQQKDTAFVLSDDELKVLYDFMNKGGGVFATGDHDDLGYALCGQVPRVRKMRKWCVKGKGCDRPAPPRNGVDRHDTLLEGHDEGFQVTDQSDDVPQRITPKLYQSGDVTYPHALFKHGTSVIRVLPDHMHEGECVEDVDLTCELECPGGKAFDEFPKLPENGERLSPEVVAISLSAGGYLKSEKENGLPVKPRCFGAVCVYEGDRVNFVEGEETYKVGRVVVDASFHHFVDINLDGTGSTVGKGFHDANGNPTPDYEAIKQYYRNIADWLNPSASRLRLHFNLLVAMRFMFPLIEEVRSNESWTPENILEVGALTRKAVSDFYSPAKAVDCTLSILNAVGAPERLTELTDPWRPKPLRPKKIYSLFSRLWLADMTLGATMISIAALLPNDPYQAGAEIEKINLQGGGLILAVLDRVADVIWELGEVVNLSAERLDGLSNALVPAGP